MTVWTRVRHPETGGEGIAPVEALDQWMGAHGWQAHGDPSEDRNLLVAQVDREKAEQALLTRQEADRLTSTAAEGRKADVLAEVGDDPDKARAALEAEKAKDKPRSTLVAALEDIVTGAEAPKQQGE